MIPRFCKTTVFTKPYTICGNIRHKPPPPHAQGKIGKFIKVFLKSGNFPPKHSRRQIRKPLLQRKESGKKKNQPKPPLPQKIFLKVEAKGKDGEIQPLALVYYYLFKLKNKTSEIKCKIMSC